MCMLYALPYRLFLYINLDDIDEKKDFKYFHFIQFALEIALEIKDFVLDMNSTWVVLNVMRGVNNIQVYL